MHDQSSIVVKNAKTERRPMDPSASGLAAAFFLLLLLEEDDDDLVELALERLLEEVDDAEPVVDAEAPTDAW